MHVIQAVNVNDAYEYGWKHVIAYGKRSNSRAGECYALDEPLAVTYARPEQRVLFDANRDANPFFHLFEALWLLAGRNDARWLDRFVGDFSSRFAEEDGHLHGSYGFRWRKHFDLDGEGNPNLPDQLDTVVRLLKANPDDRRVVIQMWDAVSDLGQQRKDIPCNLMVVPRIRYGRVKDYAGFGMDEPEQLLDITVFNRSNDIVWGMFGANAVQFSMLQEYLAGRIGVGIGKYTQISTNAHMYALHAKGNRTARPEYQGFRGGYPSTRPMGSHWDDWDGDLKQFFKWTEEPEQPFYAHLVANMWFYHTAFPLFIAHVRWKQRCYVDALSVLNDPGFDIAPDWRLAAINWMERRLNRMKVEEARSA